MILAIPGYQITEQLYESAHSFVYRGVREADDCPVILKVLRVEYPSPEEIARFKREYEMTRSLEIDGVINVYGLERYKNTLVMILEDFGGESLKRLLFSEKPLLESLGVREFLRIAIKITGILGRIHRQKIMHKDINPSNIVWNPETGQLKIIDFGISTELSREQPEIRNPNVLEGTLAYMSPEQTGRMNRAMDYRTDLYSSGATFYHLLTGQLPFQAIDSMELVHCHLAQMPLPPHDIPLPGRDRDEYSPLEGGQGGVIPRSLSDIIMKLLAKNAEDRYQSAFGLKVDLQKCLEMVEQEHGTSEVPGSFELGQQDVLDKLQIPQKLYGREQEIEILLKTFDRVANPKPQINNQQSTIELLLVTGYSGIGKSALVQEIHKPITEKRGYFISGKCDQYQRNDPYYALIQAFQNLICQLLTESEEQIARWKERLLDALKPNGQVIIEVIPEVEHIIGKQPGVPELPPNQEQNRFNLVFRNFVRAFADVDHPLVIFLDDLQWADLSSLNLLEAFMTGSMTCCMLIIGTYRDNEVSETHPLSLTLKNIRQSGAGVQTIRLAPLQLTYVNQLIVDTLQSQAEVCTPLAELLVRKTGGNPFFLTQFLLLLHEEKCITFDPDRGAWHWELGTIWRMAMTENVIVLMTNKIQKLPQPAQDVLKLAACIGSQFDLHTLSIIRKKSQPETLSDLWKALQEELIIPRDESYKYVEIGNDWHLQTPNTKPLPPNTNFKFLHDRVREAAYSLIDDDHKKETHLKIGRLLLSGSSDAEREEKLFEIVDHLNFGKSLISHRLEKDKLAELNLTAGKKAKMSAAYQSAWIYLQTGIRLLGANSWFHQYELTLDLFVEAAEAAYLNGEFEEMERLVEVVIEHANTLLDKVRAYEVKIQAYFAQNNFHKTVQTALPVLKLLGVRFPQKPNVFHIYTGLLRVQFALAGKQIEDLAHLPEMTDPYKLAAMRILVKIASASYVAIPKLLPLIGFEGIRLSLKYGVAATSPYLLAGHGLILFVLVGDIESQYRFGKLASPLLDRLKAREFEFSTAFVFNGLIRHWKEHVRETISPLLKAYQQGQDTGDLEYAAISAWSYTRHAYFVGEELTELEGEMAIYDEAIGQFKQEMPHDLLKLDRQMVLNLLGKAGNPCQLTGGAYDEENMESLHIQENHRLALVSLYCAKLHLCYLFADYPQAVENASRAEPYLNGAMGMLIVPVFFFYDSLARLAIFPDTLQSEQKRILKKVSANQKKMKKWAYHAPMNHLHKWYLVEAERARVLGKKAEAMDYYDQAIAGARENEYINEEALANELAAQFWLANDKEEFAQSYLKRAHHAYQLWGAKRKAQDLEERYAQLLALKKDGQHVTRDIRQTMTDTTKTDAVELDVTTAMKVSETLASETDLEKLPAKIMRFVLENAGAEHGMLLLPENGEWTVYADTRSGTRPEFPTAFINYAARTRKPVVLHDAGREGMFCDDPYIKKYHGKSMLAVPLIHQERLVGILFLENTLASGVFTSERLKMLKMFSSQMAISLENARLRDNLEQEVAERTQEAVEAQKVAEEANQVKNEFLSHISHELRTPLNSILGYTQLLRRDRNLTEKQREAIAAIDRSGDHLLLLIHDLLDFSKIEAHKIELTPTHFRFPEFLNTLVKNIRIQAGHKNIIVEASIPPDLPKTVKADEKRLRQILHNLLNNAIKFTEQGSVTLRVKRQEGKHEVFASQSSALTLLFQVEDTGIGIPSGELEQIFLPFHQVHSKQSRLEGCGLGLTISRELVRLMGGELQVKSVVGQGTRFWFELELAVVEARYVKSGIHLARYMSGYSGDKRTILIADDNDENRSLLKDMLIPLGFDIVEAVNGDEALKRAQECCPDLILMDLSMPVMDGFEATRQIRQLATHNLQPAPRPVIIGVSATVNEEQQQACLAAGCDAFLAKPVNFEKLFDVIHLHLGLEWQYDDIKPSENVGHISSPFVLPSEEVLQELLELAQGSFIDEIQDRIAQLKSSNPELEPFVAQLEEFAEECDFKRIVAYLRGELQD